jgi:hypothetical protein
MWAKNIVSMFLISLLYGCGNIYESADFKRHQFSQFVTPYDRNDVMYFDATFNAQFPDNDETAEEVRMEWLTAWLEQRNMCPEGFEIVTRREFELLENNPARHDIRYEVKCASG